MAMRRFRSRRVVTRRPKDYVWVTAIGDITVAENTTTTSLMSSGTWEANSLNFERATLLRVRGYIALLQTAAASTSPPALRWALHMGPLTFSAGDFSPFTSSDYDATDVLWTGGSITGNAASAVDRAGRNQVFEVDAKAKRRIDSSEQLLYTIGMGADAGANPSVACSFLFRMLINRA